MVIVCPERGIQAIQTSQPLPVSSALNDNVIVPAAGPPAAIATQQQPTPPQSSAAVVTQAPAPTGNDPAGGSSDPNEFRRFEINWNVLSYQRQGQVNLYGGSLDFTINANETVGIVADLGIHQEYIDGVDLTVTTYRFGPRFSNRLNRRVTLFTQLLAGGARVSVGDVSSGFGGSNVTVGAAGNGFSILGGAGLDLQFGLGSRYSDQKRV